MAEQRVVAEDHWQMLLPISELRPLAESELQPMISATSRLDSFHLERRETHPLPDAQDLPESIYGAAMMATLRSSQTKHAASAVHGVTSLVFICLVFNILMQFYVLYCTKLYVCTPAVNAVRALYAKFHREVFEDGVLSMELFGEFEDVEALCQIPLSQPLFFLSILVVWTCTCWVDLSESVQYLQLWFMLDRPENGQKTKVETTDDTVVATSASLQTKATVICCVLLPKIGIACYLWLLGARWLVATTSFQDLMLNAVALSFITGLDELIYSAVLPEDIKALVQMYKIARPCGESVASPSKAATIGGDDAYTVIMRRHSRQTLKRIFCMLLTMLSLLVLPMIYMRFLQQVLPGYKWDVHGPCESRISSLMHANEH